VVNVSRRSRAAVAGQVLPKKATTEPLPLRTVATRGSRRSRRHRSDTTVHRPRPVAPVVEHENDADCRDHCTGKSVMEASAERVPRSTLGYELHRTPPFRERRRLRVRACRGKLALCHPPRYRGGDRLGLTMNICRRPGRNRSVLERVEGVSASHGHAQRPESVPHRDRVAVGCQDLVQPLVGAGGLVSRSAA
jgi:hypothetical protein